MRRPSPFVEMVVFLSPAFLFIVFSLALPNLLKIFNPTVIEANEMNNKLKTKEKDTMDQSSLKDIPPLDGRVPEKTKTATFALG